MRSHITVDIVPYRPSGRYVCAFNGTEAHLFGTGREAKAFAHAWGLDCNVGWLDPVYRDGDYSRRCKPTLLEAKAQIARNVRIVDHRK